MQNLTQHQQHLPVNRFAMFRYACCIAMLFAWLSVANADALQRSSLDIQTSDGSSHTFEVHVASTEAQRSKGLMFVSELPANSGMLFDFKRPQRVTMWMKNTLIPLDILFIREDGVISSIAENAVPGSLETIASKEDVLAVLELDGGTSRRLDIKAGDRIEHALFEKQ